MNKVWSEGLKKQIHLDELNQITLEVQIDFNGQVHEWKNILLRGESASEFSHFKDAFLWRQKRVYSGLETLSKKTKDAGMTIASERVDKLIVEYRVLNADYEDMLKKTTKGRAYLLPNEAKEIDKIVKGIDRKFEPHMNEIFKLIEKMELEQAAELPLSMHERYDNLRQALLWLMLISSLIIGVGLFTCLRSTRE